MAAGAVVKGVGIAVELLLTAAADLVKDLGVRLVGLGAILAEDDEVQGDCWVVASLLELMVKKERWW